MLTLNPCDYDRPSLHLSNCCLWPFPARLLPELPFLINSAASAPSQSSSKQGAQSQCKWRCLLCRALVAFPLPHSCVGRCSPGKALLKPIITIYLIFQNTLSTQEQLTAQIITQAWRCLSSAGSCAGRKDPWAVPRLPLCSLDSWAPKCTIQRLISVFIIDAINKTNPQLSQLTKERDYVELPILNKKDN